MAEKSNRKKRPYGSGRVYKKDDVYYLQYRLKGGVRKALILRDANGEKIKTLREAEAAAKKFLEHLHQVKDVETRQQYLEEKAKLKKLKAKLTINLEEAYELSLAKPHTRIAADEVIRVSRRYWYDFVCFLKDKFGLRTLEEVEREHAEAYIAYIRANGRYNRKVKYNPVRSKGRRKHKDYLTGGILSNTTLNRYQSTCKAVFTYLAPDLGYGVEENPFFFIRLLKLEPQERDIFTEEELQLIFRAPPPLMKGLFTIGICTGLRLGDVATLRWRDISNYNPDGFGVERFLHQEIIRMTRKTKTVVYIPIEIELAEYLEEQSLLSGREEYVLPEAAELYFEHRNSLTNRIHAYLKSLGITTQRTVPGKDRKQSVKDFHSLRHCFCYYAGLRGVPLPIVQNIVGHLTQAMTRHYQSHADRKARLQGIALMRGLISGTQEQKEIPRLDDVLRQRIIDFANQASEMAILKLNVIIDKMTEESEKAVNDSPRNLLAFDNHE